MTHELETAINRAIAAKRGPGASPNPALAGIKSGEHRGTPPRTQTRQTAHAGRVLAAGDRGCAGFDPWPQRPGLARRCQRASQAIRQLAVMPGVVALAAVIFTAGLYRTATYHDYHGDWPMVTNLFWKM